MAQTKVKLTYFNPSGKYYTEDSYDTKYLYPWEIYREVRDWAEGSLTLEHMPGLASATWEGFILVQQDDGVPALICTLGTGE